MNAGIEKRTAFDTLSQASTSSETADHDSRW